MAIIQFENGVKVNFNGTPTPQDIEEVAKTLPMASSSVQQNTQQATQDPTGEHGFFSSLVRDPFQTLLVNPLTRAVQAGQAVFGNQNAGLNDQMVNLGPLGKYNVPAVKSGKQIAGDALKSAAYLAPGAGEGAGFLASAGAEAARGAAFSAGGALQNNAPFSDVAKSAGMGAVVGGGIGAAGYGLSKAISQFPKLQKQLEEQNLKLTPQQRQKLGTKLDDVTTITSSFPVSSPQSRANLANQLEQDMENSFQKALPDYTGITKEQLFNQLNEIPKQFENTPGLQRQAQRAVESVLKDFVDAPELIPTSILNNSKKFYSEGVYQELSGKVKDKISDTITSLFRQNVEDAAMRVGVDIPVPATVRHLLPMVPESLPVKQFNELYGLLITTRKLTKAAAGKADVGYLDKVLAELIGAGVGSATAGPLGAGAGAVSGRVVSALAPATAVRSAIGKASTKIAKVKIPYGSRIATTLATSRPTK